MHASYVQMMRDCIIYEIRPFANLRFYLYLLALVDHEHTDNEDVVPDDNQYISIPTCLQKWKIIVCEGSISDF